MVHKYKVQFDDDGYITGFYVPEDESQGDYEFDGSLFDFHYLNAYKIVDGQPWLDEEKKVEIEAEEETEKKKYEEMKTKAEAFDILLGEAE